MAICEWIKSILWIIQWHFMNELINDIIWMNQKHFMKELKAIYEWNKAFYEWIKKINN